MKVEKIDFKYGYILQEPPYGCRIELANGYMSIGTLKDFRDSINEFIKIVEKEEKKIG